MGMKRKPDHHAGSWQKFELLCHPFTHASVVVSTVRSPGGQDFASGKWTISKTIFFLVSARTSSSESLKLKPAHDSLLRTLNQRQHLEDLVEDRPTEVLRLHPQLLMASIDLYTVAIIQGVKIQHSRTCPAQLRTRLQRANRDLWSDGKCSGNRKHCRRVRVHARRCSAMRRALARDLGL